MNSNEIATVFGALATLVWCAFAVAWFLRASGVPSRLSAWFLRTRPWIRALARKPKMKLTAVVLSLMALAFTSCARQPLNDTDDPDAIVSRERSRQLRFELERDGAWAEVDCKVHDRFGNPLPDAAVRFFFDVPEGVSESKGIIEGKTDKAGRFFAKHKTTYACHWRIQKDGFYEARGILPFSNQFSWEQGTRNRWTAGPLTLDVALDEKSGAKLLHGVIYWKHLAFPTNTWVWFDFLSGDCVEPYGKGKNRHICFYSEGLSDPRLAIRAGVGWTNYFAFAAPANGAMTLLTEKQMSSMPFLHEAPDVFDAKTLEFTYARSLDSIFIDENIRKGQYIIFETPHDSTKGQKPHYGVMHNIEWWPGGLRMEYFFNPVPGDRRTDADIHSKWDLKR